MLLANGPVPADVLILGDYPQREDAYGNKPFSSSAGTELTRMLHEAGIPKTECFCTYASMQVPPFGHEPEYSESDVIRIEHLLRTVKPKLVITLGNYALQLLAGYKSADKWRGSLMPWERADQKFHLLVTLSPQYILRMWEERNVMVRDLKRAGDFIKNKFIFTEPKYNFIVRPTLTTAMSILTQLLDRADQLCNNDVLVLSVDIETRAGFIACIGIAWSRLDSICIPLTSTQRPEGYWSLEEELIVVGRLCKLLTHPNVRCRGQNFIFDTQYIHHHWKIIPRIDMDTMVAQSVLFPGIPKGLDFLASMYCEQYIYWKDEGKEWDKHTSEEQLWIYNCKDTVITYEVAEVELDLLKHLNLESVFDFQMQLFYPVLQMMLRGVAIDLKYRETLTHELIEAQGKLSNWLTSVLGHPLNVRSPKQMKQLFYDDFGLPVQINRKTKKPTLDDEALSKLALKQPIVKPVIDTIRDMRSMGTLLSTFVMAPPDPDKRMRCSYNIAGPETFRFSSSANVFNRGMNLQNIPRPLEQKEIDAIIKAGGFVPPNIRKLFIPDHGYVFVDFDLDRADLQVVVWEADDLELKQMLREGVDLHKENAKVLGSARHVAKQFVHGTNYGGSARTMAAVSGVTVHQAEKMQQRWFDAHPGIKEWHMRIEEQLMRTRQVSNKFGYRRFYFGRPEGILPEALAWIPQSTVACVINRGLYNIFHNLPQVKITLQVHDSLLLQVPEHSLHLLPLIREQLLITIPYDEPLTIPVGAKIGKDNWGELVKWEG